MTSILSLFSLSGKTAICTGATRGLGQAMALGLAEAGADIILAQRDITNLETKSQVEALGRKAYIYDFDSASTESVKKFLPNLIKDGFAPTILLNCAGIQRRHPAAEFPDDAWNEVIQVNLSSIFTLSRDFGAYLLALPADEYGRRGSIINIGSIMSFQGGFQIAAYTAAKAGLAGLTKALSNEWAKDGINVNAIAPGYVKTALTEPLQNDPIRGPYILSRIPAGRWGSPGDFKGVTVWLASRASAYVNGEIVAVDGGWLGQ